MRGKFSRRRVARRNKQFGEGVNQFVEKKLYPKIDAVAPRSRQELLERDLEEPSQSTLPGSLAGLGFCLLAVAFVIDFSWQIFTKHSPQPAWGAFLGGALVAVLGVMVARDGGGFIAILMVIAFAIALVVGQGLVGYPRVHYYYCATVPALAAFGSLLALMAILGFGSSNRATSPSQE